jgi:hypothetical protein
MRNPTGCAPRSNDAPVLKSASPPDKNALIPASEVLQRLHDEAPPDHFTLGWLVGGLHRRAFGVVLLLLAVVAVAPGVSIVAGLLMMVPAFQMIKGQRAPVFPRRIVAHPFPTPHLAAVVQRAVPLLRYLERFIHPRWRTPFEPTKRLVGVVVLILSAAMVFSPIPFSNVVPALVLALTALAYLEEDGVLLSIALIAAFIVLALASAAVWETVRGAEWIGRIW